MPRWPFVLDAEKAIEAVLFVLPTIGHPHLHCIWKVLYQADRLHMARYGRPVAGDCYLAMKHGPVPSGTYDLLKGASANQQRWPLTLGEEAAQALAVQNATSVSARRPARLECLSVSERECLQEAAAVHGHKSFEQLTQESCDAAWDADAAAENDVIELEHFLLTLQTQDELRAHFLHEDP